MLPISLGNRLYAGRGALNQKPGCKVPNNFMMEWQPSSTSPFDRDLELAVLSLDGPHALVFPCRRTSGGQRGNQEADRRQTDPLAGM
jgi:hypothetical protein